MAEATNILERLKLKPTIQPTSQQVIITIKAGPAVAPTFVDKRGEYDPTQFLAKLRGTQMRETAAPTAAEVAEPVTESTTYEPTQQPQPTKKAKKVGKIRLEGDETAAPPPPPREKSRNVIELGPEELATINNVPIAKRLPKPLPLAMHVPEYYMNNREIFVQFINGIFGDYRGDLLDESKDLTCEDLGASSSGNMLTHQKIVRDYINKYTPYRGLLLFHGLGAGKTFSSIGIAEGLKSTRRIIVMTPASLKRNYLEELKKYGDPIFRKNQYWEWIPIANLSDSEKEGLTKTLSSVLGLPIQFISRKGGAWLVDATKPTNFVDLSAKDKKQLDEQLDEMIQHKYTFINYNGLRASKFRELTQNHTQNIFDDAVVIVDEAHNLISRIVNKINKSRDYTKNRGSKLPSELALQIYEYLLRAKNARIVLLSGTPIVNYPNELGVLFNILRGYIKTWNIGLDSDTRLDLARLQGILKRNKTLDYINYLPSTKTLSITRNPFGFDNIFSSSKLQATRNPSSPTLANARFGSERDKYLGVAEKDNGATAPTDDDEFLKQITSALSKEGIKTTSRTTQITLNTALPDSLDEFVSMFIDKGSGAVINLTKFKRRIIGLTSYFRSAQEKLLPRYDKNVDLHVIRVPMSDYQFKVYESARSEERKTEKNASKNRGKPPPPVGSTDALYKEPSSTYRIFSRLYCNFVMPKPPGRPVPAKFSKKSEEEEIEAQVETDVATCEPEVDDPTTCGKPYKNVREPEELEGDEVLDAMGKNDAEYQQRIAEALEFLKQNPENLMPNGLEIYSPKFLEMLNNIRAPEHVGLHLVYSQFRSMEGIGIFSMVLEANGFARFRLKKSSGGWEIAMTQNELGKPTYALYTGTEDAEEREIIRNIYNGAWEQIPNNIAAQLRARATSNSMGEIIKVLMITAAGSEGINLRNTRYVHDMEPYWHPVRVEQVIGRARRICSHVALPVELQTVEVFVYLMTFTQTQLTSDASIELRLHDVGKRGTRALTSDEYLFEVSTIKEEIAAQLLRGIKEAAIDCATHAKSNSKEGLTCLNFGQPSADEFAYNPTIESDQDDTMAAKNVEKLTWQAVEFTANGKKFAYRRDTKQVYDYESYMAATEGRGVPILLGILEKKEGKFVIVRV